MRVYEVARDLGLENKAVVALFQAIGVTDVPNHMSAVAPEQIERVKRHIAKQSSQPVEERIHATVVKRRAAKRPGPASSPVAAPPPSGPMSAPAPASAP